MTKLSVIVPTHNPHRGRLERTLAGLHRQTLPVGEWEILIVDNASSDPSGLAAIDVSWHPRARVVDEPQLGLTSARLRGFAASVGELLVLVDDDNVLDPDYLSTARDRFAANPRLAAAGGRSRPEFESPPAPWVREFDGLLALRDRGDIEEPAVWRTGETRTYPACAPIGAGMVLRRAFANNYIAALNRDPAHRAFDRTGSQLVSGGDNDIVLTILAGGGTVAYVPDLRLTHLISWQRTEPSYLGRLNRAIARSWIRVLALHGIRPWSPVSRATVPLRQARSWLRTRAWRGPAHWIRWQGACGHFEGLADLRLADAFPR